MRTVMIAATLAALAGVARAQEPTPAKATLAEDARQDVAVTIYNNNYGLVRETRKATLPKGIVELEFMGAAEKIDPTSLSFRSISAPAEVAVLEQNRRNDLISLETMMERNVGRKIVYRELRLTSNTTIALRREGTLLSTRGGAIVKFETGIEINPPGTVVFDEVPPGLLSAPAFVWLLRNNHEGEQTVEASYLANELNWKADYVAVIAPDETKLDLKGWATLTNTSGASFRNAEIKLVAGEAQRTPTQPLGRSKLLASSSAGAPEDAMAEKSFFDYHLYTLGRRADLLDKETKQLSLLDGRGVATKKIYSLYSAPYDAPAPGKNPAPRKLAVALELVNDEAAGLGAPIPAGRLRAYKADADGALQLVGEDGVGHTPRGEPLRVKMGEAFDVTAERTQASARRVADSESEATYKIVVRNAKKEAVSARVIERMLGDWKITQESQERFRTGADEIEYALEMKPESEATVSFTVRINFMPTTPPARSGGLNSFN